MSIERMASGYSLDSLGGFHLNSGAAVIPISSKKDSFRLAFAASSPLTRKKLYGTGRQGWSADELISDRSGLRLAQASLASWGDLQ